eukprot:gnl/TRDRNA2_/TRDRNA2_82658_c0_seq1.p1 gnl/TRDRNA2_/TRDRNA2_82658_c0~~gnl/TRDRNA2_/TRDRNA2_82658_c0_seq1.p1  ORF type:complete len:146 (-),score=32.37 gnl/TRDRNA2_/TRDRNA2_82658_c0_seq1:204-641(-)
MSPHGGSMILMLHLVLAAFVSATASEAGGLASCDGSKSTCPEQAAVGSMLLQTPVKEGTPVAESVRNQAASAKDDVLALDQDRAYNDHLRDASEGASEDVSTAGRRRRKGGSKKLLKTIQALEAKIDGRFAAQDEMLKQILKKAG